jgi:NTP pyrophosphatase (non-canonical NTP hydrolase)
MSWLTEFAEAAQKTDRFIDRGDHLALLAAGLIGEAGSVATELKKESREREAYPAYRHRMVEEIGDFAWYFVRIISLTDGTLLSEYEVLASSTARHTDLRGLKLLLELGVAAGEVVAVVTKERVVSKAGHENARYRRLWAVLLDVCREVDVDLGEAVAANIKKISSRWPTERIYVGFFDNESPEEEQLPRTLDVEFRERTHGQQSVVVLRCNGINFGDRITDNIQDPDGYRYHDIFHFAHAVHLGWSPVVRALLRCKRKSDPTIDEAQDGARAGILEEAVAAIVFSRAKRMKFFEGIDHLDYDLLKTVREFLQGYEVADVPLWQWEAAILDGYRVFRELRSGRGGRVVLDLTQRQLSYSAPRVRPAA